MTDGEAGDGLQDLGRLLGEPEQEQEPKQMDLPPQMEYGVSVFQMREGEPVMHVHSGPDVPDVSIGELWRLVSQVKMNLELEMQASKFAQTLDKMRQQRPKIVKP